MIYETISLTDRYTLSKITQVHSVYDICIESLNQIKSNQIILPMKTLIH